jgi:predicted nucleotidyltransferase
MIDIEAGLATVLTDHREEILEIAARHGAHNVRVFGSAARGSDTSSSDVDLLVDLDRGRSLFDLTSLIRELQVALERDVDVVTEDGLYWLIRRRILSEARPL